MTEKEIYRMRIMERIEKNKKIRCHFVVARLEKELRQLDEEIKKEREDN